ncbi:MAG: Lrp/AsnC family transcriptional regulator [Gordonia sp. (in: high G+C Gram-positive bacteria)]
MTITSNDRRPASQRQVSNRILAELRKDGRANYTVVAKRLGIPRQVVTATVERAVAADRLRLTVSVSPDLMGIERFAYAQILIDRTVAAVRNALVAMPETTFVADMAGQFPLEAELRVRSDPGMRATLDRIASLPNVRAVQTTVYESIEANHYSPLSTRRCGIRIDDLDRTLIRLLGQNCRAPYRELADSTGLSPSGARVRTERLFRTGAIRAIAVPVRASLSETTSFRVGVRSAGKTADTLAALRVFDPEFLAVTIGQYDFIATVTADSADAAIDITDEIRELDEVASIDIAADLRIVKERYVVDDWLAVTPRSAASRGH